MMFRVLAMSRVSILMRREASRRNDPQWGSGEDISRNQRQIIKSA
ncbi:MAG: hypothetical protein VSS75_002985 [Candidatus Parabeggiatoa sp.]|nr:hypothetical protein [Candidatus Parabeggiatoa sp.]